MVVITDMHRRVSQKTLRSGIPMPQVGYDEVLPTNCFPVRYYPERDKSAKILGRFHAPSGEISVFRTRLPLDLGIGAGRK